MMALMRTCAILVIITAMMLTVLACNVLGLGAEDIDSTEASDVTRRITEMDATGGEGATSWFSLYPERNLQPISISNASGIVPVGILGRGNPLIISQSASGGPIAVGTTSGVSLIDPSTLMEVAFIDQSMPSLSVSFSPDGSRLAVGLRSGQIRIYDMESTQLIQTIQYGADTSRHMMEVAFSPDGRHVAVYGMSSSSGSSGGLWDIDTGDKKFAFEDLGFANCWDFDPQGQYLAFCASDVYLVNVSTGESIQTIEDFDSYAVAVRFSPDGSLLSVVSANDAIHIWDVDGQAIIKEIPAEDLLLMAFSSGGNTLVTADTRGNTGLIDLATGQYTWQVSSHDGRVLDLEFIEKSQMIISSGEDGKLRIADASNGMLIRELEMSFSNVNSLAFSPDGDILAAGHNDKITLWNPSRGQLLDEFQYINQEGRVVDLAFSPDGNRLASTNDESILVWNVGDGSIARIFIIPFSEDRGSHVWSLAFDREGTILVSGSDEEVRFWDLASGEILNIIQHEGATYGMGFIPESTLLAYSSGDYYDPIIFLYDVNSGQVLRELKAHTTWIESISFNSKGTLLASSDNHGMIIIWGPRDGSQFVKINGSPVSGESVNALAFNPGGDVLASAGTDGRLRLWDVVSGALVYEAIAEIINGERCSATCLTSLAFSPDGRFLAIGSADGTVRLWGVPE